MIVTIHSLQNVQYLLSETLQKGNMLADPCSRHLHLSFAEPWVRKICIYLCCNFQQQCFAIVAWLNKGELIPTSSRPMFKSQCKIIHKTQRGTEQGTMRLGSGSNTHKDGEQRLPSNLMDVPEWEELEHSVWPEHWLLDGRREKCH